MHRAINHRYYPPCLLERLERNSVNMRVSGRIRNVPRAAIARRGGMAELIVTGGSSSSHGEAEYVIQGAGRGYEWMEGAGQVDCVRSVESERSWWPWASMSEPGG